MTERMEEKKTNFATEEEMEKLSVSFRDVLSNQAFFLQILDDLPFGCYIMHPDQKVIYWNQEAERLIGYTPGEVVGKRCGALHLACSFVDGGEIPMPSCPAIAAYRSGRVQSMKMFMRRKAGDNLLIRNTMIPLRDGNGKVRNLVALFFPVTEDPYDEERMRDIYEVATRDPLTCLPGRRYMESCIDEEIERYRRTGHPFAVMFTDVDRFHDVNNGYGHRAGDELLREFGHRLRNFGRRTDRFCRWGGDEFVGILQLKSNEDIRGLAERFLQLSESTEIVLEGEKISCMAAIGITVVREDDDRESVIARADRYMFRVKGENSTRVVTDCTGQVKL